ncbi:MAG: excinuclease ABC subunit UvrC [Candidatus Uhrbacteria bacterium]|nr:excinuclease ABC subunit UvrC [Candidatus Uhrbacteria bacterium]
MIPSKVKVKNDELPDVPGVYLMKDAKGTIIYVGKATSLKRRVSSYFQKAHDGRIEEMVSLIRTIDYIERPTVVEALILEANLIKHYWPKYNIKDKDNRSFLYLVITKEDFPRPLFIRGSDLGMDAGKVYKAVFGPYTSPRSVRAALEMIRPIFPWTTCTPGQRRACFYHHLKLCPGVCIGVAEKKTYQKTIRDLIKFFEGKKEGIISSYRRQMLKASKAKQFEEAAVLRNKIFALEHIRDVASMKREDEEARRGEVPSPSGGVNIFGRVEGYDISHVSGTSTVASMVVFEQGAPAKAEYRKFRIKTVIGSDDYASIREVMIRRFRHPEWRLPDLVLIDGGIGQVRMALHVLKEMNIPVPVIGMVKGRDRKRTDLVCEQGQEDICKTCEPHLTLLTQLRDEAHRFAITYHRKVRGLLR